MKKQKNKAFSLIELSIVLIIIGLLIAGIVGGKELINVSSLSSARSLTNSSPVAGIEDLSLWLETTSKKSFDTVQPSDNSTVNNWHDINPQSVSKYTLPVSGTPEYLKSAVNDLPGIQFDTFDYFTMSGNVFEGSVNEFTAFAVVGNKNPTKVLGDDRVNVPDRLQWNWASFATYAGGSSNVSYGSLFSNASDAPHILTVRNSESGTNILLEAYVDGGTPNTDSTGSLAARPASSYYIGRIADSYSSGGILSEFIIFNRALSDFEREQVEEYLGKKWKIPLK